MKVVLFRSVDNLGDAGQIVDVKDGYFRNYLGPRGYARLANRANLALMESRRKKLEAIVARERSAAMNTKKTIDGTELRFELRANDRGQLFGSITAGDIAAKLQELKGFKVDRRTIEISENIKHLGKFLVKVRLYSGVYGEITVYVDALLRPEEKEALEAAAEAKRKAEEKAAAAQAEAGTEAAPAVEEASTEA